MDVRKHKLNSALSRNSVAVNSSVINGIAINSVNIEDIIIIIIASIIELFIFMFPIVRRNALEL